MKIIFLGTNGWYDTNTGNTICTLIDSKKCYIILDAGDGIYKLDKYVKEDKPIYLFLSHLHLEHVSGFHIFPKFNFKQGINVFLQKGKKKFLDKLVNSPYTKPLKKLSFDVKLHELIKIKGKRKIPFQLNWKRLSHTGSSLGFSIEMDGKKIVYCSDTSVCKNDLELSKMQMY